MDAAHRAPAADAHSTPLSVRVVEAIASREAIDPIEVIEPLYDAIDPDALDSLFDRPGNRRGRITFQYHGYQVTVHSDGEIDVAECRWPRPLRPRPG